MFGENKNKGNKCPRNTIGTAPLLLLKLLAGGFEGLGIKRGQSRLNSGALRIEIPN